MSKKFIHSITLDSGLVEGALFANIAADDLPFSGVTAGQYTLATVTVDQYGRVTQAANGGLTAGSWLTASTFTSDGTAITGGDTNFGLLFKDKNGKLATGNGTLFWDPEGDGPLGFSQILYVGGTGGGESAGFAFWDANAEEYIGFYTASGNNWEIKSQSGVYAAFFCANVQCSAIDTHGDGGAFNWELSDGGGFTIRTAATPGPNITQWTSNNAGTIYSRINKDGYIMTRKIAAPADGDLVASECAWWFDSTNGASKVMFKGKSADGTVVTGEVALA